MKQYIICQALPDANEGTEVNWNFELSCYEYPKSDWPNTIDSVSRLTLAQVCSNPQFFIPASEWPEHFGYHNPIFSRKDVLDIMKSCDLRPTDSAIQAFNSALRERAKVKSIDILESRKPIQKD